MYLILPKSCGPHTSVQPFVFDRLALKEPKTQHFLAMVHAGQCEVWCACQQDWLPMVTRKLATVYYVARAASAQRTAAAEHAPLCFHACGDAATVFGFKPGVISQVGERNVLNWELLFKEEAVTMGGGGGGGPSGKPADHSLQLRSLAWFVLTAAGMNAFHPELKNRKFFHSVHEAAEEIALSRPSTSERNAVEASKEERARSLASRTLFVDWFDARQKELNKKKLVLEKAQKQKTVLTICPLPAHEDLNACRGKGEMADLYTRLGAKVRLPLTTLDSALSKCSFTVEWHKAGGSVLMIGLATVKALKKGSREGVGYINHLSLMPLHEKYVPVPTAVHASELDCSIAQKALYVVNGRSDPGLGENAR